MTIKHIAMVLEAGGLDGPEKLLLIAYCNRTDDHGYCWPGQQRLAHDTGTSPATVKRVKKRLMDKKLIASERRVDPRTGDPITNLTRVNIELLGAMKRASTAYDDNMVERLTFDTDAPLPKKKKKAPKGSGQSTDQVTAQDEPDPVENPDTPSDQVTAQDEPDLGLKMDPTPGQVEPGVGGNLSPTPVQVEPLTVSDPPENPQTTVLPSGAAPAAGSGKDGGKDGKRSAAEEIPYTEGVRFLQQLGLYRSELMLTGKALADQSAVVDDLFRRGWTDDVLWTLMIKPLPQPVRTSVGAVLAGRLREALDAPVPGQRKDGTMNDTYVPVQFDPAKPVGPVRHYECEGKQGSCGVPVECEGDLCRACSKLQQPAYS